MELYAAIKIDTLMLTKMERSSLETERDAEKFVQKSTLCGKENRLKTITWFAASGEEN